MEAEHLRQHPAAFGVAGWNVDLHHATVLAEQALQVTDLPSFDPGGGHQLDVHLTHHLPPSAAHRCATGSLVQDGAGNQRCHDASGIQTRVEAGRQAEARDDVELELLRRSWSALRDEPIDQGYRLCLTDREVNC
jgi:hypothetical protein